MGYESRSHSLPMGGGIDSLRSTYKCKPWPTMVFTIKKYMISKIEKSSGEVIYEHKDEPAQSLLKKLLQPPSAKSTKRCTVG